MKRRVLKELNKDTTEYISGQVLSDRLGISRTAVWKHINTLRDQGYRIDAIPNRGYRLSSSPDLLIPEEVYPLLKTSILGRNIIHRESLDSTTILAKKIAEEQKEGTIVVAEEQTGGRGRLGRQWHSPRGGLWVSIILKPKLRPDKAYQLTQVAAVAAVKAISGTLSLTAGIKWPNDIIIKGKKVCGILTEMNAEADIINYIILSLGVNVNADGDGTPDELASKMTFLSKECGYSVSRKILLANLLQRIEEGYIKFLRDGFKSTVEDCRKFSVILNHEVRISHTGEAIQGRAVHITDEGVLLVETPEGKVEVISGDVSVRGIKGYL